MKNWKIVIHLHSQNLLARSSSGLGHLPFTEKITGSNPVRVTNFEQKKKNIDFSYYGES